MFLVKDFLYFLEYVSFGATTVSAVGVLFLWWWLSRWSK